MARHAFTPIKISYKISRFLSSIIISTHARKYIYNNVKKKMSVNLKQKSIRSFFYIYTFFLLFVNFLYRILLVIYIDFVKNYKKGKGVWTLFDMLFVFLFGIYTTEIIMTIFVFLSNSGKISFSFLVIIFSFYLTESKVLVYCDLIFKHSRSF